MYWKRSYEINRITSIVEVYCNVVFPGIQSCLPFFRAKNKKVDYIK